MGLKSEIPPDCPSRIKELRAKLGLTQARLAELMGVSFASVRRWENGQSRPSAPAWRRLHRAEAFGGEALDKDDIRQPAVHEHEPAYEPTADNLACIAYGAEMARERYFEIPLETKT